jgi:hypothetical protein
MKKTATAAPVEGQEDSAPADQGPKLTALSEICAELGIKPQAARIKLRKKFAAGKAEGFRWTFTDEQVAEVKDILTAKGKAKADPEDEGEDEAGEGE